MASSQRLLFGGIAALLVGFPLIQSARHSTLAIINTIIALVGAAALVAATRLISATLGSVVLSTLAVALIPQLGSVYAYGVAHGSIPERSLQQPAFT